MVRVKPVMAEDDYVAKMESKDLTPDGSQLLPDPTPIAPPLGYIKQPSITERIRQMVQSEHLRREAEAAGAETFEEANDFDISDDPIDPHTPYEAIFDPVPEASTGVPTPPSGGAGEGAEGGKPAASAADKPLAGTASPASPKASDSTST